MKISDRLLIGFIVMLLSIVVAAAASAATMWTDWTSSTAGAPGSAVGTLTGVTVNYAGELDSAVTNGTATNWAPNTSFIGGTVTTFTQYCRRHHLLEWEFHRYQYDHVWLADLKSGLRDMEPGGAGCPGIIHFQSDPHS